MPYYQTWEEFARAAEKLYLTAPMKVRVVIKYRHCDGNLRIKVTDDAVVCSREHVFTIQDGPGPGREEDRETAWQTDEAYGVQGKWCHGNGLNPLVVLTLF
uniref:SRP9 domain-containing protein n=1 Tax=Oncorhynchus tshawytscha TaxID=74940 RepID=A0A8C8ER90_ONCTS